MTSNEEGFTAIEFIVSIFMTLIVMGVIYSVFRLQTRSLKSQENRMEAQQYTRSVLNLMVREVRNLGHFPGVECTTSPVHVNGIIAANDDVFHFVTDANADDLCDDENENILYSIDTANCPTGFGNIMRQDFNATPSTAQALTDCNFPTAGSDPLFVYYPKDSTIAYATPVGSVNLGNIQRLLVTTTVESKNQDSEFGGASTAVMKSNVDLRNRGLPQ